MSGLRSPLAACTALELLGSCNISLPPPFSPLDLRREGATWFGGHLSPQGERRAIGFSYIGDTGMAKKKRLCLFHVREQSAWVQVWSAYPPALAQSTFQLLGRFLPSPLVVCFGLLLT